MVNPVPGYCCSESQVEEITDRQFIERVLQSANTSRLLIVEFYAPFCPACMSLIHYFHDLAERHPNQMFTRLDVTHSDEVAYAAKIEFLPTFIYYKFGREVDRYVGTEIGKVEDKLNEHKLTPQL